MTAAAPMRLVCPGCGVYGSIEAFANDPDARAVAGLLGELQPDVATALQRYMRLHAPAKHALTWRKARKVLDELVPLIKAGTISRNGRDWPAPGPAWISGIDSMLGNKNVGLPLKGHGYLLTILAGEANKTEAVAERATEESKRGGNASFRHHDADEDAARRAAHVRTAVAMIVKHATSMRMKYRQPATDQDARVALGDHFPADVVNEAIEAWKRLENLR